MEEKTSNDWGGHREGAGRPIGSLDSKEREPYVTKKRNKLKKIFFTLSENLYQKLEQESEKIGLQPNDFAKMRLVTFLNSGN